MHDSTLTSGKVANRTRIHKMTTMHKAFGLVFWGVFFFFKKKTFFSPLIQFPHVQTKAIASPS